ncbi:MAG TPA: hypothetical protein VGR31_10135 [Planctomycetota bacterium]|jgi:hypothetical protein|nr:hypothetical protein [Planctomycetota bacterium]
MNAGILLSCVLSLVAIQPPNRAAPPGAADGTGQLVPSIHIRAWIDGRSRLILDDNTATWQHFDFAAPGRLGCNVGLPVESTFLDGVAWDPIWPDVPDCENRFCGGCFSSTFSDLQTSLPNSDFTPVLVLIQSRNSSSIVEYPSAANGYRVVIEFDDDPPGGADWYEVELLLSDCTAINYCTSTVNSSGSAATISVTGSLGVAANDTQLLAAGCPPGSPGFFFYGANATRTPFGNGYLCVSPFPPGLFKVFPMTFIAVDGRAQVGLDLTHLPAGGEILAGSTWRFQFWFRDNAAGGAGMNLSDAAAVRFCP